MLKLHWDCLFIYRFEKYIFLANEAFAEQQQNEQLIKLFNEQNTTLRELKTNLEDRIQKRKKSLQKSQKRFEILSHSVQTLHKSLMIIHKSKNKSEIETLLSGMLKKQMQISKVFINTEDNANRETLENEILLPLVVRGEEIGFISFQLEEGVDLNELARMTHGFVGADLANLVNEAALLSARQSKERVEMNPTLLINLQKKNHLVTWPK